MMLRDVSKYRERSSRTSSASRLSDNVVNPTRSAKSTVTRRRSATGAVTFGAGPFVGSAATPRAVPHSGQNFAAASTGVSQDGHVRASALPHSLQNFAPGATAVWHDGQATAFIRQILGWE